MEGIGDNAIDAVRRESPKIVLCGRPVLLRVRIPPGATLEERIGFDRAFRLPDDVELVVGVDLADQAGLSERDGEVTIRPFPAAKRLSVTESGQLVCVSDDENPTLTVDAEKPWNPVYQRLGVDVLVPSQHWPS